MNSPGPRAVRSVLPLWQRRAVYALASAIWLTGAGWLIFQYFIRVPDQFGFDNPHPLQRWWLVAHAVVSLGGLWIFGLLWHHHIARGWEQRLRRPTGGTLFGLIAWLALSGCALYYLGDDQARSLTSLGHWILGLGTLAAFLLHDRGKKT